MTNKPTGDDEKLGHDPLEWLAEEQEETLPPATDAEQQKRSEELESSQPADESAPEQGESEASDKQELSEARFVLPERLTVQHVEAVYADLSQVMDSLIAESNLQIDAGNLNTIDSSGFQLLVSTLKSCQAKSCELKMENLGESVQMQLRLLGDDQIGKIAGGEAA